MAGMAFWSFKITDQKQYPDRKGELYVFDNRHSMRVKPGDRFVYEEKLGHSKLQFVGVGTVADVLERPPNADEGQSGKVQVIYSAVLRDYQLFAEPVDVSYGARGKNNRDALGIANLNQAGLSRSVARIDEDLFVRITKAGGLDPASASPHRKSVTATMEPSGSGFGVAYKDVDTSVSLSQPASPEVDPSIAERGLRAHRVTQQLLAQYLRSIGIEPQSPVPGGVDFDLGWHHAGCFFVAEVKSITVDNEERHLRLGLGQVLWYAHNLRRGFPVTAVLVAERAPANQEWAKLCANMGVILTWPEEFSSLPC